MNTKIISAAALALFCLTATVASAGTTVGEMLSDGLVIPSSVEDKKLSQLIESLGDEVESVAGDATEAADYCDDKRVKSHKRHPGGALEIVCDD